MSAAGEVDPDTLEERVRVGASRLIACRPAVRRVEPLTCDVWRVDFTDGWQLVAKHQLFGWLTAGTAYDLLEVERHILDLLGEAGCAVPRVLGVDCQAQLIFLEYCGDQTLDDVVQEVPAETRKRYGLRLVEIFIEIEEVFRERGEELRFRAAPQADETQLGKAWRLAGRQARRGMELLLGRCPDRPRRLLDEMLGWLGDRSASLGSTDYNARNVVVDPSSGRLSFIEFAKIGWDWPERRLVQYATSLGAGRPRGNFEGLLGGEEVEYYAARIGDAGAARALDGHHLVFHLNAAALLCGALVRAEERESGSLLQAWRNPRQRLERLLCALITPLSADPLAVELRSAFCRVEDVDRIATQKSKEK